MTPHFLAGNRRKGTADPGKQQFEIFVDFGGGPYCRAGIAGIYALLNGNGRRNTFNIVHLGLLHAPQKLTGIAAQAFHVATLAISV